MPDSTSPVVSLAAYANKKRRQAVERRLPPRLPASLAVVLPMRPNK